MDELLVLGDHCSEREQRAADAERELNKVKLLIYLSDKIGMELDGVITGVENFGLFITGIEIAGRGLRPHQRLTDDFYRYDRAGHVIAGFRSGNSYRLGDTVRVAVAAVDIDARELDFRLVGRVGGPKKVAGKVRAQIAQQSAGDETAKRPQKEKPTWKKRTRDGQNAAGRYSLLNVASRSIVNSSAAGLRVGRWLHPEQMLLAADQEAAADGDRRCDDPFAHFVLGQLLVAVVGHAADKDRAVFARAVQLVARQHRRRVVLVAIPRQVDRPDFVARLCISRHVMWPLSVSRYALPSRNHGRRHVDSQSASLLFPHAVRFGHVAFAADPHGRQKLAAAIGHDRHAVLDRRRRDHPPHPFVFGIEAAAFPQAACRSPRRDP